MQTIFDDVRFTLRQLRRSPGFVLTAVLTLTMAITANVVVYGIVNGLILRPLPVPNPKALVQIQNPGFTGIQLSYPNYVDLAERTQGTFSSVALARLTRFALVVQGTAQPAWGLMVGGTYFRTLGLQPQLGRLLTSADDVAANGSSAMVLSDSCWRTRFHADPNILGKVVPVGKIPFTVVGVAPRGFFGTERFYSPDAWLPFHDGPEVDGTAGFEDRDSTVAYVFGRLRPGVSRAQADADLQRVSAQMAKEHPREDQETHWHTAPVGLFGDSIGKPVRGFVAGLSLLASLVFLAACANLGVLFSARTADRARELGIRLAIGSTRSRILRQLFVESALIAILGGFVAGCSATLLLRGLSAWHPRTDVPLQLLVGADWSVYLISALLALLTAILFGALPARQIWRTDPNLTMRTSGSTGLAEMSLLRSGLLLVQITLCCLLVTASLVAFRGLQRTFHVPLGFEPNGVTLATVDVMLAGYKGNAQTLAQQHLLNAIRQIPGVTAAAYSNNQPLSLNTNTEDVYAPGTTTFDHAHVSASPMIYSVSSGYFDATQTSLVEGRSFTEQDDDASPRVAIVNETLARQLFGTIHAAGRYYPTGNGTRTEVVGVVADGKYLHLAEDASPALFVPILQHRDSTAVLIARSNRSPTEMAVAMRKAVASVDSSIPVFAVSSWPQALGLVTFPARAATLALGVMGALAAMLAITGIFGVASYSVARRMREFGIRVALGSGIAGVLRAALGKTTLLVATGSGIGLALGVASSRLLANIVYHATALDPLVLTAVALTMAGLGCVASVIPARRALRATPADLLREA